ncbi:four-carbon acid sugar kinase family protein [Sulfobacillus thermosulfidooxidans]|uniref:four-carbon acid sugar kinase family protein n=1 Tax=Sulfobacillus thermosulfidooxidans TaxID=28034 RepID=UPI0006B4FDF2|nr:four-carbon acid sugar kinase family protein [Sulfobacillus thermosulfidooxidans]
MLIIADDLSGALDTGVIFSGLTPTKVVLKLPKHLFDGPSVLAWTTESRHLPADEARRNLQQVLPYPLKIRPLYKKVDATLRGPVGAEIETLLHLTGMKTAVLCPSFPTVNKIVKDGHLYVDGKPLETTALGTDPRNPLRTGDIQALLRETTTLRAEYVSLNTLRHHPEHVHQSITRHSTGQIVVVDAETDDDLAQIAKILSKHPNVLPCGSLALALQLRPYLVQSQTLTVPVTAKADKALIMSASLHPATQQQINYFRTRFPDHFWEIDSTLLSHHTPELINTVTLRLIDWFSTSHFALLSVSPEPRIDPNAVTAFLGQLAQRLINDMKGVFALAATGGDMTSALCRALGITELEPVMQWEPGIVQSRMLFRKSPWTLVSKSGSYGSAPFFIDFVRRLL